VIRATFVVSLVLSAFAALVAAPPVHGWTTVPVPARTVRLQLGLDHPGGIDTLFSIGDAGAAPRIVHLVSASAESMSGFDPEPSDHSGRIFSALDIRGIDEVPPAGAKGRVDRERARGSTLPVASRAARLGFRGDSPSAPLATDEGVLGDSAGQWFPFAESSGWAPTKRTRRRTRRRSATRT